MGLFGRKKKEPEKPKEKRITFDSPLGKFYYINNPPTDEYGYEGYIIWTASGTIQSTTSGILLTLLLIIIRERIRESAPGRTR